MTEYKNIRFEFAEGVARIIFNRPPLNILNIEMMKEINQALEGLVEEKDLRLIVFCAEHKAFSAGVDVGEHMGDSAAEMIKIFHQIFRFMVKINKPSLALVYGSCLGGGCEVALFCDMILARDDAKFGQPEIQVGVFPPVACVALPKIINQKKALELLLTGSIISAAEAEKLGLVNKVFPADQFEAESNKLIGKVASLSAPVLKFTRKAAMGRSDKEFLNHLEEVENIYLNSLMLTKDANEGLKAFMEKRKPEWKNR
ncbi:MAG: enoyl-CoA hydratase/isomerase family protein [Planctomycetes bacterium]|nr:enoyl-CoA hydratase/isomerase family protein [Planctomycetota bacterium]